MTTERMTLSASTTGDDIRLFLGGLGGFDTIFIHNGRRRACWHLAKGLRWPRSADVVVPSQYRVVARVTVLLDLPRETRDLAWRLLTAKAIVFSLDPRSLARRKLPEPERQAFILGEIEEGSLPNRADWLRHHPPRRGREGAEM